MLSRKSCWRYHIDVPDLDAACSWASRSPAKVSDGHPGNASSEVGLDVTRDKFRANALSRESNRATCEEAPSTEPYFLFVATHHVLPEVSLTPPTQSPQVISAGSLIGLAPRLTARL